MMSTDALEPDATWPLFDTAALKTIGSNVTWDTVLIPYDVGDTDDDVKKAATDAAMATETIQTTQRTKYVG